MAESKARSTGTPGQRFRAIAWIVLLAFTLQSFITQTHIHGAVSGLGNLAVSKVLAGGSSHTKSPAQDSTNDCPFCQAISHAGAFSTPSAPGLFLPVAWIAFIAIPIVANATHSISSHPWHSRAPPQH